MGICELGQEFGTVWLVDGVPQGFAFFFGRLQVCSGRLSDILRESLRQDMLQD